MSPQQLDFYTRIDEILYYKWDPIGVSDGYWSRDEYQSYLPKVYKLAMENDQPEPVAAYLTGISSENMGLPENQKRDMTIAKLILYIKKGLRINEVQD